MTFGSFDRNGKMVHDWVRERMSTFLDGRLSGNEVAELKAHLGRCAACRGELRALRATRQILRAMPMARVPRAFTLEAAPSRAALPRSFFFLRTATAMAAAAFVALLAASTVLPVSSPIPASAPALLQSRQPAATAPVGTERSSEAPSAASQAAPAGAQSKSAPATGAASPAGPAQPPPTPGPSATGTASAPAVQQLAPSRSAPAAADSNAAPVKPVATTEPSPSQAMPGYTSATAPGVKPQQPSPGQPQGSLSYLLLPLQLAAGALTGVFALASGAVWWVHRRRRP